MVQCPSWAKPSTDGILCTHAIQRIGEGAANPLGNGKTYSYAMYYVATDSLQGINNSIGVAFSNDGLNWRKYPHPVISPETLGNYGVGQPALYNTDHKAGIRMFYEDYSSSIHH